VQLQAVVPQQQVKESVRWCTESLLVKCHKGHHVPLCQRGGRGVLRHAAGFELHHCHEPLVHEASQMTLRDLGRGPVLFCHGSRGKEKQRSLNPKNLPFPSSSLFLFRRREGGEEGMMDSARGCRGAQGRSSAFIAVWCQ
jgi:hypothetical protein